MPIKYKIRKGDPVVVIAGKNRVAGTQNAKLSGSKVVSVDRAKGRVIVENANVAKRHTRPNQLHPNGGIVEKAMPLDISNVMYCCPKCNRGVRLGVRILENGKKARFCKSCSEVIDKD